MPTETTPFDALRAADRLLAYLREEEENARPSWHLIMSALGMLPGESTNGALDRIREALRPLRVPPEGPAEPRRVGAHTPGVSVACIAGEVRVAPAWLGDVVPRTPPPPLTPEQINAADRMARAWFDSEPGKLTRTVKGQALVYRRVANESVTLV